MMRCEGGSRAARTGGFSPPRCFASSAYWHQALSSGRGQLRLRSIHPGETRCHVRDTCRLALPRCPSQRECDLGFLLLVRLLVLVRFRDVGQRRLAVRKTKECTRGRAVRARYSRMDNGEDSRRWIVICEATTPRAANAGGREVHRELEFTSGVGQPCSLVSARKRFPVPMKTQRHAALLLLAVVLAVAPMSFASDIPDELEQAVRIRDHAVETRDASTWERMTMPGFIVVRPEGRLMSRAERSLQIKTAKAEPRPKPKQEQFIRYGDTVIRQLQEANGTFWIDVWVKDRDTWRVASSQGTRAGP